MIMGILCDKRLGRSRVLGGCPVDFSTLRDRLKATEAQLGMKVYIMHEDIFRYMHRI